MTYLPRSLIRRKGEPAVWRIRQEGARSTITGHPALTWLSGVFFDPACFDCDCFVCDANIEIIVKDITTREETIAGTRMTKKVIKFFTWPRLHKYDQIDYHGETYEVESSESKHHLNGQFAYQDCIMAQVSY